MHTFLSFLSVLSVLLGRYALLEVSFVMMVDMTFNLPLSSRKWIQDSKIRFRVFLRQWWLEIGRLSRGARSWLLGSSDYFQLSEIRQVENSKGSKEFSNDWSIVIQVLGENFSVDMKELITVRREIQSDSSGLYDFDGRMTRKVFG